jgi:hypothetical protein
MARGSGQRQHAKAARPAGRHVGATIRFSWRFEGAPAANARASGTTREMDAAFAAFLADATAPKLMLVWPRVPARIKRRVTGLLSRVAGKTAR